MTVDKSRKLFDSLPLRVDKIIYTADELFDRTAEYGYVGDRFITCIRHNHREFEFIRLFKGQMEFEIAGKIYSVSDGDLLCINSYESHYGTLSANGQAEYIWIRIDFKPFIRMFGSNDNVVGEIVTGAKLFPTLIPSTDTNSSEIGRLFTELFEIDRAADEADVFLSISILCQIMSIITKNVGLTDNTKARSNRDFMDSVHNYIVNNYQSKLSTIDAAKEFGLSKNYFCSQFKKHFNMSFTSYLNNYRINRFIKQYNASDGNLRDAIASVGFPTYSHFYNCFEKTMGQSPKKYFSWIRKSSINV